MFGDLAEQGCVVEITGITGERRFKDEAVCFDSQDEVIKSIIKGKV